LRDHNPGKDLIDTMDQNLDNARLWRCRKLFHMQGIGTGSLQSTINRL
jgi:hypothetical protein